MVNYHLLIVEDDPHIQRGMRTFLERENYQVTAVETGEAALKLLAEGEFAMVLLDMMLPGISGEQVLAMIRQTLPQQPVMIISALDDEFIQIDAYEQQIEDYVVKPFSMNILLYKINRILGRIHGATSESLMVGELVLYPDKYQVFRDGQLIVMTTKEFEILLTMAKNPGRVYSRDELLTIVWGYEFPGDSRTVDVHIKNIRQKIGKEAIQTVKGVGYRLC